MHSSLNELNVYNLDVLNSFNFFDDKNAKENIYVKFISKECKTRYKLILKVKKAGPLHQVFFFAQNYIFLQIFSAFCVESFNDDIRH